MSPDCGPRLEIVGTGVEGLRSLGLGFIGYRVLGGLGFRG